MYNVTDRPLKLQELIEFVVDPGAGAITTFIGTTRNNNQGRKIYLLEYEAYDGMAQRELKKLGDEANKKWEIKKIAISHRIGVVPIGEPSVAIAVSTPHRRDGFEACQFLIDELKKRVPIWKKEKYEGGEVWIGTQSGVQFDRSTTSL